MADSEPSVPIPLPNIPLPTTSGPSTPRRSTFTPRLGPQMSALSSADGLDRIVARRSNPADASRTRSSVSLMPTPTPFWSCARLTLHRQALYHRDPAAPPSPPLIAFQHQSGSDPARGYVPNLPTDTLIPPLSVHPRPSPPIRAETFRIRPRRSTSRAGRRGFVQPGNANNPVRPAPGCLHSFGMLAFNPIKVVRSRSASDLP
jgi:hypothetical protein